MRALLCWGCHRRLEAADEEELSGKVLAHLKRDHPVMEADGERIREMVAARSYRYEWVVVYAGGNGPDEEFGPEPY